jgi:hypothetical protein
VNHDQTDHQAAAIGTQTPAVAGLVDVASRLSDDGGDFGEFDGPIYWPTRDHQQAEFDWPALAAWVDRLRARFPHMTGRIPECWYRHNDLVEALLALRDHERVSYSSTAPGSAAVEWHRAFRDMESRWDAWIKRFTCAVPGKGHRDLDLGVHEPDAAFSSFVTADLNRRARDNRN